MIKLIDLARELWPIHRSLGGDGFRESLKILKKYVPELKIKRIPSGRKIGTWKVPPEWVVLEAHVIDPKGNKIFDYFVNDLYLASYSTSFSGKLKLSELKKRIFTDPNNPSAIPYRTFYYSKNWSFCASFNEVNSLIEGYYFVRINTKHINGELNFGEIYIKGKSQSEIIFSTYLCHPQMASNELSGPVVLTSLSHTLLKANSKNKYSYRFLFLPETIGAINYLDANLEKLKTDLVAGYVCTCLGDSGSFSIIRSKNMNNYAEKLALRTFQKFKIDFNEFSFLERGSDERQFLSPKVNLPFCTLTRTPFGKYPEYHTSLDNLDFISDTAMKKSLNYLAMLVKTIESEMIPISEHIGEPFFTKYGLREKFGAGSLERKFKLISDIVAYSDGSNDIQSLSEILSYSNKHQIKKLVNFMKKIGLLIIK